MLCSLASSTLFIMWPYNLTLSYNLLFPPLTSSDIREVSVTKAGANVFTRYLGPQDDLRVPLGDDVELDCSTSASETPKYSWLKEVLGIS